MDVGLLDHFRVRTPRPNLMEATETIEQAMGRLRASTSRLEALVLLMQQKSTAEREEFSDNGGS